MRALSEQTDRRNERRAWQRMAGDTECGCSAETFPWGALCLDAVLHSHPIPFHDISLPFHNIPCLFISPVPSHPIPSHPRPIQPWSCLVISHTIRSHLTQFCLDIPTYVYIHVHMLCKYSCILYMLYTVGSERDVSVNVRWSDYASLHHHPCIISALILIVIVIILIILIIIILIIIIIIWLFRKRHDDTSLWARGLRGHLDALPRSLMGLDVKRCWSTFRITALRN